METIKIKQVRSRIRCPKDQKAALDALGLKKLNRVVELPRNESVLGNIKKVHHLVEEIKD
ncbi:MULTISPECIES: 50S ribosomal protein L30 [environmental samples]|uniref:50S ribosomal protein L30 n=1 Tax=environmental samples TaxID=134245 RepID=UPI0003390819|nr:MULTISPECIES: 50S ribosomal protein L30 [environmental samples]CCY09042.1 50S ribosomal protein L30 [Porphyromonas sp. CAG:1061]